VFVSGNGNAVEQLMGFQQLAYVTVLMLARNLLMPIQNRVLDYCLGFRPRANRITGVYDAGDVRQAFWQLKISIIEMLLAAR